MTDLGRKRIKSTHASMQRFYPSLPKEREIKEDADGWSKWLMREFGVFMINGGPLYFETEIEIPVKSYKLPRELS